MISSQLVLDSAIRSLSSDNRNKGEAGKRLTLIDIDLLYRPLANRLGLLTLTVPSAPNPLCLWADVTCATPGSIPFIGLATDLSALIPTVTSALTSWSSIADLA